MVSAVVFDDVSKIFRVHQTRLIKDALLGIAGHRGGVSDFAALSSVSFSIAQGERVALLGPNGAGKSTALKLISGILSTTTGAVYARGRIAPLLELGSGFHPDLTGRENVFLNGAVLKIPKTEIQSRFNNIVEFSGIGSFLDTPVKFYSSGMLIRLGFSVAVHCDPDVLLLDEVLAVGDAEFQQRSLDCVTGLMNEGRTTILVTHDLASAKEFADRALILESGMLVRDVPTTDL